MGSKKNISQSSLGPRLSMAIPYILKGLPLWDIGCDHGHFGIFAMQSLDVTEVFFVDKVPEILSKLASKIAACDLPEAAFVLLSGKAQDVVPNHAQGTFLIAGLGSETIISIVSSLLIKVQKKAFRLILIPHTFPFQLRHFLRAEGLGLVAEELAKEGKQFREMLVLDFKSTQEIPAIGEGFDYPEYYEILHQYKSYQSLSC